MIKKSNHLNRLVTSPLTEMATKFHLRNGAKLLYKIEQHKILNIKIV